MEIEKTILNPRDKDEEKIKFIFHDDWTSNTIHSQFEETKSSLNDCMIEIAMLKNVIKALQESTYKSGYLISKFGKTNHNE